jgi:hypothetical protein
VATSTVSAKARAAACGREQDCGGGWGGARVAESARRERAVRHGRPEVGESRAVAEVVAVSVDWASQTELGAAHAERRADADLGELFAAHDSTAFHNLVLLRHDLGHDPADRRDARPESEPSLDTCEQLSRDQLPSDQSPDEPPAREGVPDDATNERTGARGVWGGERAPCPRTDTEEVSQATEALRASISRSRERQEIVLALVMAGEVAHAERVAKCMCQSVQLECPTMAGGCGSDDNYTPITCDSRLCSECMDRAMGLNIEKYLMQIQAMDWPTLLTLTIENVDDLEKGKEAVQGAFGRLRQRTIPTAGTVTREADEEDDEEDGELVTKKWVWKQADDGGEPADDYWKSKLCASEAYDLARRVQKQYVEQGKQIPWKELVDGGVYGIDILQTEENEDGTYNVHIHVICEMPYIPQAALSAVWEDLTGAPVVDVRRIREDGELDAESALSEVIGYVTKPPEFESMEEEVEYLTTLKGARLVQPFGSMHGNTPRVTGLLLCSDCHRAPRWWNYKGVVDEAYDNMEVLGSSADGDRPPPDSGEVSD